MRRMPLRLHLPHGVHAPERARRWLSGVCQDLGCPALAPDAELLVSELTTNAVLHAGTACDVAAAYEDPMLIVTVSDELPGELAVNDHSVTGEAGRGLLIVDTIAKAWGVIPIPGGKSVWFALWPPTLAEPPEHRRSVERLVGVDS